MNRSFRFVIPFALAVAVVHAGDPSRPEAGFVQLGSPWLRHSETLCAVAFSRDGKRLASAGRDGTVRVWETGSGRPLLSTHAAPGRILALAFAADERRLVVAWENGDMRILDAGDGSESRRSIGTHGFIGAAAFSPDGSRWAFAAADGTLRVAVLEEDLPTVELACEVTATAIAWSPDGRALAAGGADGTIRVWASADGASLLSLRAHATQVQSIAFSPRGDSIATAGYDGTVRLWNVRTGAARAALAERGRPVNALAFAPDGGLMASAGSDRTLQLWDPDASRKVREFAGHCGTVTCLAFSPDGRLLASGGNDNTVRLWRSPDGAVAVPSRGHEGPVTALAFTPDGRAVATGSADGRVKVWNPRTGRELLRGYPHSEAVSGLAAIPRRRMRLLSSGYDRIVQGWDPDAPSDTFRNDGAKAPVLRVAVSPDGRWWIAAGYESTLRVFDAASGRESGCLEMPGGMVLSLAVSPDGKQVAAGNAAGTLRIWETGGWTVVREAGPVGGPIHGLAFLGCGRVISAHEDGTARVWGERAGPEIAKWDCRQGGLQCLAVSPCGLAVATGGRDGTVRIWIPACGSEIARLPCEGATVSCLSFSPCGRRLGCGLRDSTARIWDLTAGFLGDRWPAAHAWAQLGLTTPQGARDAYRAYWSLAAQPGRLYDLVRCKIPGDCSDLLKRLLADLDSDDFRARDEASAGLEMLAAGPNREGVLRAARRVLDSPPSLEVEVRLGALLAQPTPNRLADQVRLLRAAQLLRFAGARRARALLGDLAGRAEDPVISIAARQALEDLEGNLWDF